VVVALDFAGVDVGVADAVAVEPDVFEVDVEVDVAVEALLLVVAGAPYQSFTP